MDIPATVLEKIRPRAKIQNQPRNAREEQLTLFLDRINPARRSDGLKPISYSRLAKVLEGIPTEDLHPFYKQCDQAKNFSRFFWWSLKAKV